MLATAKVDSAQCNNDGICTDPLTKRAPLPTVTATKPTDVPATITAHDFTPTIVPPICYFVSSYRPHYRI